LVEFGSLAWVIERDLDTETALFEADVEGISPIRHARRSKRVRGDSERG
jgi:hypothetical protein